MTTDDGLSANYQRAFGKRIGFGTKPALIMIDFVQAYFDKSCALYAGVEDALTAALRLQASARENGVPVIYTNVVYDKRGSNGGRFYQKSMTLHNFVAGSPMGDWPPGLNVASDELVISKQYPSAFFGTSLASTLASWGVGDAHSTPVFDERCCAHLRRLLLARLHPDHRPRGCRRPAPGAARSESFRHGRQIWRRGERG